jgi:hypothetical protein
MGKKVKGLNIARTSQCPHSMLVNRQSFGQCALAFAPIEDKCIVVNREEKMDEK